MRSRRGAAGRQAWLFASLGGFTLSWLPGEAVAALTLAAIALPGQLATARLAGMPPVDGLFAFAAGTLAFAALGAHRFMSVGADSTIAPIMAGALATMAVPGTAPYAGLAALLALLVGAVLLLAGLLRAGWIADLLSIPVTTGFLAGIAIHIIAGEAPVILGIAAPQGPLIARLAEIVRQLPQAEPYPAAIGLGVLGASLLAARLSGRLPGALIGLAMSGLAVWLFGLERHGVAVMGALSLTPPAPALAWPSWGAFTQLLPVSLTVALVCMMQTGAVARSIPSDPDAPEALNRDFAAIGVGNLLAALMGAFAVDASPPGTAAVAASGGRSQLATLLALALVWALVLGAAGAFAFVPQAALSGVLVYIGFRLFRLRTMRQIYRQGGWEILLVGASAALVVILPIETGVAMSIVLSLMHSVYVVARPACAELARVPGTTVWWPLAPGEAGEHEPGVLVFAPGAPINFTNANYLRQRLLDAIAAKTEPCRLVVIEANGVAYIDFTGSQSLQQTIRDLRRRHIDVALARLEAEGARRTAAQSGLIATLGADHVFRSVEDALRRR